MTPGFQFGKECSCSDLSHDPAGVSERYVEDRPF